MFTKTFSATLNTNTFSVEGVLRSQHRVYDGSGEVARLEAEQLEAQRLAHHPSYTIEQIDFIFDWMEQSYPGHIPTHQESYYNEDEYRTRHYPSNNGYLFVKDSRLYFHSDHLNELSFSLRYLFELSTRS